MGVVPVLDPPLVVALYYRALASCLMINLETLCQNNPFLIVLIGDLNAKSKNWYFHDKTSHEGIEIENATAQFGLQQ